MKPERSSAMFAATSKERRDRNSAMDNFIDALETVCIIILDVCILGGMLGTIRYLREAKPLFTYLQEKHPGTWRALGMPEIVPGTDNLQASRAVDTAFSLPVVMYLVKRRFGEAGDPALDAACAKPRQHLVFTLFCAAGIAAVTVPPVLWITITYWLPRIRG